MLRLFFGRLVSKQLLRLAADSEAVFVGILASDAVARALALPTVAFEALPVFEGEGVAVGEVGVATALPAYFCFAFAGRAKVAIHASSQSAGRALASLPRTG